MTTAKRGAPGGHTPLTTDGSFCGETDSTIQQSPRRPQALNWRGYLDVHPAAEMFPLMSEADLKELAEDIKKNGLRNPIVTWSADRSDNSKELLLDGRNRLDAMVAAGITLIDHKLRISCRKIRLYGTGGGLSVFDGSSLTADPYEYVISANIHRRHLTAEQKRDLIGKLLKAKPGSSNLQIAKQVKAC